MQKRKFDELISRFNRKVSDMGIDQKYKMELVGMISAIGFAHEKELSTNLAEVGTDCISRQAAIELVKDVCDAIMSGCESWYDPETEDEVYTDIREVDAILKCNKEVRIALRNMPSVQPKRIRGRWIPVTENTLPDKKRVVVVCGEKGTWDYGMYRGYCNSNIHLWEWKKKTLKWVYWWMYKEDALPEPYKGVTE